MELKKLPVDVGLIIGIVILLIGAAILLNHYNIFSLPVSRDLLHVAAGFGCAVGGLHLFFKALGKERSF